jgi:IS30 family transposase
LLRKWSKTNGALNLPQRKYEQLGIPKISHETIYKWIWESKHTNTKKNRDYKYLYKELKHGKRGQKSGNIKNTRVGIPKRVHIMQHPVIVKERKRIGDL